MAIATAAKQIIDDGMPIAVGGGLESISLVQNEHMNRFRAQDPWLVDASRRRLHADARHRRDRRRALRHHARARRTNMRCNPAAHRRGAGGRAVRRRDRAAADA